MQRFKTFIKEGNMGKLGANRGDLAEIILGAAVTARFFHPPQVHAKITKVHVEDILRQVLKSKNISLERPDRQVGQVEIDDNIKFRVGVPALAWTFISNTKNWPLVSDLFNSAIAYASSDRRLRAQAFNMYANNKKDEIFVNADGTGDQKGTKADIKLLINGRAPPNQISLKVKGGEQFDQVAGVTFEKQTIIWGRLGINVKAAQKSYEKFYNQVDFKTRFYDRAKIKATNLGELLRKAAAEPYQIAAKQLEKGLKTGDNKMIMALGAFIKKGAVKDEDNIELVKLSGDGVFKRAKFGKKYIENFKAIAPTLKVEYSRKTDPIVKIFDPNRGSGKKGLLIQIRGKYTAESSGKGENKYYKPYFRNIVEAGDLFFEIATDR